MHVVMAGSSGFLGQHLLRALTEQGHQVTPLVRRPARRRESSWDPYNGIVDRSLIAAADVVINLAGSPTMGNPHSNAWANELRESRIATTQLLAQAVADAKHPPAFLAGNGISFYGDQGATPLDESRPTVGDALLTDVTREWQEATLPASRAGARVVVLRTAPVMDIDAPPLKMLARLFRAGLGGQLGGGGQYFPMISLRDWIAAVILLAEKDVSGPANLCCEHTPTNREFTKALAKAVHRPALARVPAPLISLAAGKMAPEVLGSINAVPKTLLDAGYHFHDPDVAAVLRAGLNGER